MAGLRGGLSVVLTAALLLVSVCGWEEVNEAPLWELDGTEQWGDLVSEPVSDQYEDYDDGGDADVDGVATSDVVHPLSHNAFELANVDSGQRSWVSGRGFQVEATTVHPSSCTDNTGLSSSGLGVVCGKAEFQFTLTGQLSEVKVLGETNMSVMDVPGSCGYDVGPFNNNFTIPFSDCNVEHTDGYKLRLSYIDENGQAQVVTASCEGGSEFSTGPFPRSSSQLHARGCKNGPSPLLSPLPLSPSHSRNCTVSKGDWVCCGDVGVSASECEKMGCCFDHGAAACHYPVNEPLPRAFPSLSKLPVPSVSPSPPLKARNCAVSKEEWVRCGELGISFSACETMGCCFDDCESACYYPLDECSDDHHFVFAIRYNSAFVPVDTTKLVTPGMPHCKPVIVNDKVAIFKFQVTECGTHSYKVGETVVYLTEVQTVIPALKLKYGIIARTNPLSFVFECRYYKNGTAYAAPQSLVSVGYTVKIPSSSLPSTVISDGLYGVELRIAKDATFSSYWPSNHHTLRLLLGTKVFLELNLLSPTPDALLLVHYCVAYPRSAKNALVLIYEGCANPYDPTVAILKVHGFSQNGSQRRFSVEAFQFMDITQNQYLDEEIYFMCSVEICMPLERKCEEHCFDGKAP
uniref:ZP domain-containing protein n=1 Tax=Monopterus albus TaxID=43700 RepID=A0A3Q3JAF5_MONAL|nr:zona pellucida sperm-binding protein 4-like [Monopterus albus]